MKKINKDIASDIVLRSLGLLLLTAAVLKGHELLTTPVKGDTLLNSRWFQIFQAEFELVMGLGLLSGLYKRLAWLASVACFSLFCCVTLYKGLSGAESCGCFGNVHVNPWTTLFAIDIPAVVLLLVFRPDMKKVVPITMFWPRFASVASLSILIGLPAGLIMIGFTPTTLAADGSISAGSSIAGQNIVLLKPKEWIGNEMPILKHIDIAEQLKTGSWLVVLYHHDCPNCAEAISEIEEMARNLRGNEDFMQFALIEMPPYHKKDSKRVVQDLPHIFGNLDSSKDWFVTTPAIIHIRDIVVQNFWQERVPSLEELESRLAFRMALHQN